jgi:hypothetical protein
MPGQHASGAHQPKHRPQDQQVSLNLMALGLVLAVPS